MKRSPLSVARTASIVQYSRATNALDLPLALDHESDRDGLDPAGRQPATDLATEQRAQGVADETVDDPASLLRVDEVLVDPARIGEGFADRGLRDLAERHAARLVRGHLGRLGHVPGDRLALSIEVGREIDEVAALRGLRDVGDLLAPVLRDHVVRREVMLDVHAELALARVLGQVADMAIRGEDPVVRAQVAFDRPSLCRRFDDRRGSSARPGV